MNKRTPPPPVPAARKVKTAMLLTLAVAEGSLSAAELMQRTATRLLQSAAESSTSTALKDLPPTWRSIADRARVELLAEEMIEERPATFFDKEISLTEAGYKRAKSLFSDRRVVSKFIDSLSGTEFERLMSPVLADIGFSDIRVIGRSHDGGVDVEAEFKKPIWGGTYLFQCKNWRGRAGVSEVREFFGTVEDRRATKGVLVCPGGFTADALAFAKKNANRLSLVGDQAWLDLFTGRISLETSLKRLKVVVTHAHPPEVAR